MSLRRASFRNQASWCVHSFRRDAWLGRMGIELDANTHRNAWRAGRSVAFMCHAAGVAKDEKGKGTARPCIEGPHSKQRERAGCAEALRAHLRQPAFRRALPGPPGVYMPGALQTSVRVHGTKQQPKTGHWDGTMFTSCQLQP